MATKWTISGVAADPLRLAEFWAAALGYILEPGYDNDEHGASIVDPDDLGPAIGFLHVPEPKTAKNRLHLDIRVAGRGPRDAASADRMRTKAAALVDLGAVQIREDFYGPELGHIVMQDPEGNEFCVG
ncbi:VOC family protein [Kribbella sp. C-35]|uniref:VOC family protein n=1 Tax=Kribbella sp. C-35 TaxID=2789276 RepID=UPI003978D11E